MAASSETSASRGVMALVVVLIVCAFALLPALTRTHLEGFTYFTETMSLLPDLSLADRLWQVNQEFFYLSRPGMVWAMAPFSALSPGNGYAMLMALATPLFLVGAVLLARNVSSASWPACLAALLAVPITLEAQFFYNDNVLACALSLWAMILVLWSRQPMSLALAGAIYSAAVLVRLDQVLLAPYFALLVVLLSANWRELLIGICAALAGFLALHLAVAAFDPEAANPLARFAISTRADALWERSTGPLAQTLLSDAATASLAFGLGLPAIFAGAVAALKGGQSFFASKARVRLVIYYPTFIYLLTIGKYYDPRAFLIMVPFLLPLAALGLDRWVFEPILNARAGRPLIAAVLLAPILIPGAPLLHSLPSVQPETESPVPSLTGRIWHHGAWRAWQETQFRAPDREAERLAQTIIGSGSETLVLSSFWNSDRRLQHALASAGFEPVPSQGPCAAVADTWAHSSGARALHLRAHVPFLPNAPVHSAALFLAEGRACLKNTPAERRIAIWRHGAAVNTPDFREAKMTQSPDGFFRVTDADIETLARLAQETLAAEANGVDPTERFGELKARLN
ncbi:MAG: hypothetical protein AAGA47_02395 [Pseudomonadota bacterium]